ncbi:GlxA family transcriptional regulator [Roseovarius aquimarinus]|uniref:GlxA family transcriptional regulator n=1 Tax=Roseovarius aquimarinus TaxID=1229156 RepID=A0ABW7I4C4_9RHOB
MTRRSPEAAPIAAQVPLRVSYILVPGYSMLALSSAIEPLRSVNRLMGQTCYEWRVIAARKGPVEASNGLDVQAAFDLGDAPEADLTIVVASLGLEQYRSKPLERHLRALRGYGRMLGAVSNGTLLLAQADVIGTRNVTVHWETIERLTNQFPDLRVSADLYRIDDGLHTAAGGTASMDMMLDIIGDRQGRQIAAQVSEQFLHGPVRPSGEAQRNNVQWRYRLTDARLENAIRLMEENLARPVRIARLADIVGLSERQFERLFRSALQKSPSAFYMDLRLQAAYRSLVTTTSTLEEIAESMGFSSQGHFGRAFKAWCGKSPMKVRAGTAPTISSD